MAFPIYREIHAPTAVETAGWARLLPTTFELSSLINQNNTPVGGGAVSISSLSPPSSSFGLQLVIARQSVLDIYTIGSVSPDLSLPSSSSSVSNTSLSISPSSSSSSSSLAQLHLLASFPLAGNVQCLEIIHLRGKAAVSVCKHTEIDAILLTFKDAKVSLVGLDPFTLRLKTLGMLNFEEGSLGPGATLQAVHTALNSSGLAETGTIRVDHDMRCGVMVPYDDQLAVIPFNRSLEGLNDTFNTVDYNMNTNDEDNDNLYDQANSSNLATDLQLKQLLGRTDSNASASNGLALDENTRVIAEQEKLSRQVFRKPYLVTMKDLGVEQGGMTGKIIDMNFLSGYAVDPTLSVLVERALTTTTRLASLAHTVTLAALSLDLTQQTTAIVWQCDGLPHDCCGTLSLPLPLGGVLVFSVNAIQYFNASRYCGLALNAFASSTVNVRGKYPLDTNITHNSKAPIINTKLDGSRAVCLTPDRVLITERDGTAHMLHIFAEMGEIRYLTLFPLAIRTTPSVHLALHQVSSHINNELTEYLYQSKQLIANKDKQQSVWNFGLLFQASRTADSCLSVIAYRTSDDDNAADGTTGTGHEDDEDAFLYGGGKKRIKRSRFEPKPPTAALVEAMDDEDDLLYGNTLTPQLSAPDSSSSNVSSSTEIATASTAMDTTDNNTPSSTATFLFYPVDSLPNFGPVIDCTIGRSTKIMTEEDDEPPLAPPPTEFVMSTGNDRSGAFTVLHRSLRAMVMSQQKIAGCMGLWYVPFKDPSTVTDYGFVLLTSGSGTRILATSEETGIEEIESGKTGLVTTSRTLGAGALLTGSSSSATHIVQVLDQGINFLKSEISASLMYSLSIKELQKGSTNVQIVSVNIMDPFILLRLSDGSLRIIQASVASIVTSGTKQDTPFTALPSSSSHAVSYSFANLSTNTDIDPYVSSTLYHDHSYKLQNVFYRPASTTTPSPYPVLPLSHYIFTCRRSGTLEVFTLPYLDKVLSVEGIHLGPALLIPRSNFHNTKVGGSSKDTLVSPSSNAEHTHLHTGRGRKRFPRTFIADISVNQLPEITLSMLSNQGQLFVYRLLPGIPPLSDLIVAPSHDTGNLSTAKVTLTGGSSLAVPRRGQYRTSNINSSDVAASGRIIDSDVPLQFTAAEAPRFWRIPHTSHTPTAAPDPDDNMIDPVTLENSYRTFRSPRFIPFTNVSGWTGVAVLSSTPLWLFSVRGNIGIVPMGVPDVTGVAGATSLPGDHMFETNLVTAFTPFHTSFCEYGFIYSHQGYIQFAQLPSSQWPTANGFAPRPFSPNLVLKHESLTHLATLLPLELATATMVHTLCGNITVASAVSTSSLRLTNGLPAEGGWNVLPSSVSNEDERKQTLKKAVAHIVPGPSYAPFYKHSLGTSIYKIGFLEAASNQFGAQTLTDWFTNQSKKAEEEKRPLPIPPTSTQVQCCIQPLYVAALSIPKARDTLAEIAWVKAELDEEKGEHIQIDYGEHIEFTPVPLPSHVSVHKINNTVPTEEELNNNINEEVIDPVAMTFNKAQLGFPPTTDRSHSIALIYGSGNVYGTGFTVADNYALAIDEHVLAIREIPLTDAAGSSSRARPAIVVGTGFTTYRGEDYRSKGRILVFRIVTEEVLNTNPEAIGSTVTVLKLKLVYEEDAQACVTALAPLTVKENWVPYVPGGTFASARALSSATGPRLARHIVAGSPRRLQVYEWNNGKLRLIAFVNTYTWIKDVISINDYILYGDSHHSVRFFKWRDEDHQLIPVAIDSARIHLSSLGAIVHETSLGLVVADTEGNIQIMAYAPFENRTRLVVRSDIHIGSVTDHIVRSRLSFPIGTPFANRRHYGSFFGTFYGSVGAIQPLDEMTFKRLFMLQRVLTLCLPHTAGLNPRLWRQFASKLPQRRPRMRNFLDSTLLWRYLTLSTHTQIAFAEASGSTWERILANLRAIDASGSVF